MWLQNKQSLTPGGVCDPAATGVGVAKGPTFAMPNSTRGKTSSRSLFVVDHHSCNLVIRMRLALQNVRED